MLNLLMSVIKNEMISGELQLKTSKLSTSLLASTAVFAGVLLASGHSNKVSAASYVKINYSSNVRQTPTTAAKIVGGLSVGSVFTYTNTATANGYTCLDYSPRYLGHEIASGRSESNVWSVANTD
jgi:hypothetical protein